MIDDDDDNCNNNTILFLIDTPGHFSVTLIMLALIIAINFIILKFKKFTKLLGYLLDKRKKVTSTCDKSLFKKFSTKAGFHNCDHYDCCDR